MPEFQTSYFGSIVYEEESVLHFPLGLPGFAEEGRFLLIEQAVNKPIVFLQSLSRPELCFMTLPILTVCPDYELVVSPEDLRALELAENRQPSIGAEVLCLAVVSLVEDSPPSANLLSPIVVNWRTRSAVQAIQVDSSYSHQHPLLAPATVESCS